MSELVLPRVGRVERLNGGPVAYRVVDEAGDEVHAVSEFFRDLAASDCSPATLRSYAYDLLGWLRFLWTVDMAGIGRLGSSTITRCGWAKPVSSPVVGAPTLPHPARSTR